jgi:hypothetical protein
MFLTVYHLCIMMCHVYLYYHVISVKLHIEQPNWFNNVALKAKLLCVLFNVSIHYIFIYYKIIK